jgi:antitoxin YefM
LISVDDYRALEETAHLLRAPANVRRLLESLDEARSGKAVPHELDR